MVFSFFLLSLERNCFGKREKKSSPVEKGTTTVLFSNESKKMTTESPLRRSTRTRKIVNGSGVTTEENTPVKAVATPTKKRASAKKEKLSSSDSAKNWGRSWDISIWTVIGCIFLLAFCPFLVLYFWMACDAFSCSVVEPFIYVQKHSFAQLVANYFPKPT
jgi:hypothetical protein